MISARERDRARKTSGSKSHNPLGFVAFSLLAEPSCGAARNQSACVHIARAGEAPCSLPAPPSADKRASERKSQKLSSVCLRGGPESLAGQQSRLWTLLAAPPLLPVELFALYLAKNWRASLQSASGRAARCASPACVGSRRAAIDRPANNNNNNKLACRRAASQPPATGFRKNTLARVACLSGLSS